MSAQWSLHHDPTHLINGSTLSDHFGVPHHPAKQDVAQKHEDIVSALNAFDLSDRSFEYIIVGGVTAGLALASRLAATLEPGKYVCVIEAGEYRRSAFIDLPGAFGRAIGQVDYDWSYETVPQVNLNYRRVASSAGRLLGGSSAINYIVRQRASSLAYDVWSQFGDGWDWEGLLPHFKASESYVAYEQGTDQIFPGITWKEDEEARENESNFRGHSGPVHSTHNTIYTDLLVQTIETTLNEFSIKTNRTPGYGDSTGMFNIDTAVDRERGIRSYAANSYLHDPGSMKPQSNLIVLKGVYATKILFGPTNDGTQDVRAVGLECLGPIDWKFPDTLMSPFHIAVTKEIIVSAGSYNTPRLLELSGIGNANILSNFHITPIVELPTVGENLQEHPMLTMDFIVQEGMFTLDRLRNDPLYLLQQVIEYRQKKTGVYATTVSAYGFFKLEKIMTESEVQGLKSELDEKIWHETNPFYKRQLEIQRDFLEKEDVGDVKLIMVPKVFASDPQPNTSYIGFVVSVPHPVARGSHISSDDPLAPPNINPNYLDNNYDRKILTKAAMFVRKLCKTEPLKSIIVSPSTPGPEVETEAQFEDYVRSNLISLQHPLGTSAMAPKELGGVVDQNLRVYGTDNVRVADMSIAPTYLSTHLQDTAYAVGEKAAALIINAAINTK